MYEHELLLVLPLASGAMWIGIGLGALLRRWPHSPFEVALILFAFLLGSGTVMDWYLLSFVPLGQTDLALLLANTRGTLMTLAIVALLLACKWICFGHSRYDLLVAIPLAAGLGLLWSGLNTGATWGVWLHLVRDRLRYGLWAGLLIAALVASSAMTFSMYRQRSDLEPRLRRKIFWTTGSVLVILGVWLATNVYGTLTESTGVPWFSSALWFPAVIVAVTIGPMNEDEWSDAFSELGAVPKRVFAAYLFYRTGEPLVALSATTAYPIEAEQLESVLDVVGNFMETSIGGARRGPVMTMRFEGLGLLSVRGNYVVAAAIYDGRAHDALRSSLFRIVRKLEAEHGSELETWEQATAAAETVADELSSLLYRGPMPRLSPTRLRAT